MYRILIVEDDPSIAGAIEQALHVWGYDCRRVRDFQNVTDAFWDFQPHLVLLDILLPFFNGYHWCEQIRKTSRVPILFLSSASDNMNIIMAVNMGGDDFLAKPFDLSVLTAKVQALLRRSYDMAAPTLSCRGAVLDPGDSSLRFAGQKIELTRNECRILTTLLEQKGSAVSREQLMQRLWETDSFVDENTLTVNINRLRKKLESYGLRGFIATRHGVGYLIGE